MVFFFLELSYYKLIVVDLMADVEMEQPKAEPKEEVVETNGNADKIQEAQGVSVCICQH